MTDIMITNEQATVLVGWPHRTISDMPTCTALQLLVLQDLKTAQDGGYAGVDLKVNSRCIKTLLNRCWIAAIQRPQGTLYSLTARGERALRVYSLPVAKHRTDGLCPACGERPKDDTGYCHPCYLAYHRRINRRRKRNKRQGAL